MIHSVAIYHHMDMGDHFICNGLVREIVARDNPRMAYIPTRSVNLRSVVQMYADDPRIVPVPVQGWPEAAKLFDTVCAERKYRIGNSEPVRKDWDIWFYECAGVPHEKRWSSFKCHRDLEREAKLESIVNPTGEPFVLVHDHSQYKKYDVPVAEKQQKIFLSRVESADGFVDCLPDWIGMILKAEQVHCVDSGFVQLAMSIRSSGMFHDFGRCRSYNINLPQISPGWTVVKHQFVG